MHVSILHIPEWWSNMDRFLLMECWPWILGQKQQLNGWEDRLLALALGRDEDLRLHPHLQFSSSTIMADIQVKFKNIISNVHRN